MSYLLDTCVLSETVRPRPNDGVMQWLSETPDEVLHISVLTIGEIRKGVETMATGQRRERLLVWLEHELPSWFGNRILPVDRHVAETWGMLQAQAGRSLPAIDSLLAATAMHHGLRLVTRNVRDFQFDHLQVINPWSD